MIREGIPATTIRGAINTTASTTISGTTAATMYLASTPTIDPSTSSQPTLVHVSSSSISTRRGDNVAKLTTQLGIIVRNGNIVPLTFLDWNNVPDDIVDAIWKDLHMPVPEGMLAMSRRAEENKFRVYEFGGSETLGSALRVQPCSDEAQDLSKCSIQWYRIPTEGSRRELISGANKSIYSPEHFDVGRFLEVDVVSAGQKVVVTTSGPIGPAAGLASYVETLLRKPNTEFNLKLPYQIVAIVSGALNDTAAKKYDLEGWFPASSTYKELITMGRKRKPNHPRRMMSDVLHNRTSIAPPSEEASHRPPSERPVVPPPSDQPSQRPLLLAPPLEEASQRPPSEGPLVPPHRPPSVAPQQLPCTQPPRLPSVHPPSVAPQQLSSRLESSAYEPSADPSTSSQPTLIHVSSSSISTRRGGGCAKGIREWGTGKKLDIQFDENYCPIGDNVAKLTTQLSIIVRNGNIVPLTFLDWNNVPDDIVDAIWKDLRMPVPEGMVTDPLINVKSRILDQGKLDSKRAHFCAFASLVHKVIDPLYKLAPLQFPIQLRLTIRYALGDNLNICPEEYKPICMNSCNSIWKNHKNKIKVKYFKLKSSDPNLKDDVPLHIVPSQNAIFHELVGHDGHGYCRTYGRTVPQRVVYKDGIGPSQSKPQPSTIVQITQQVPDASSGHRAFRESAEDENPFTPPPEDQV
ncbi:hypothetical protein TEA_015068 [Camellia sinensis var. sinensis]|uniref:Stomatal closure-related actin-binding protein Ig domain-containing protein n=1 Tax=Camellia sinensis var. sinensis TaxID=542762 RepID=A0A4S4DY96_CAMSN|nr:hypothetical protein TEA_015068 [Camellia sinensis var. sinensis]